MKKIAVLIGIAWLVTASAACTVRYSQSITGSIHKVQTYKIMNSDNGIDVGLGFGGDTDEYKIGHGIAFREPKGPAELAGYPCDAQMTQVDYRSKWYAEYIRVDSPEVEVTTYCIGGR
jgi:hypothetical protein